MALAETDPVTGLKYIVTDGKATIIGIDETYEHEPGYAAANHVLKIPETIDDSIPVVSIENDVSIGSEEFLGDFWRHITSADLSDATYLTTVGQAAFFGLEFLESISFPQGVTTIGHAAFVGCARLKLTSLPESLTSIGSTVFFGCKSIELTSLPRGLIGVSNFGDWEQYKGILKTYFTMEPNQSDHMMLRYGYAQQIALNIQVDNTLTYEMSSSRPDEMVWSGTNPDVLTIKQGIPAGKYITTVAIKDNGKTAYT